MAFSGGPLSSAELANKAADKPIINGRQAGDLTSAVTKWVVGTITGTTAALDDTDPQFPAKLALDRKHHAATRPDTADTLFTFAVSLLEQPTDPINSNKIAVDMIHMMETNFGDLGGATLVFQVADDILHLTNNTTVATLVYASGSDANVRRTILDLDDGTNDPARIVSQFWRIGITLGASGIPQIGEFWLGRRRQLIHQTQRPATDLNQQSTIIGNESDSGVLQEYTKSVGKAVRNDLIVNNDTVELSDINGWWSDGVRAGRGFTYIEKPETAQDTFHVFKVSDNAKRLPLVGPVDREFALSLIEQGPHLELEQNP